LDLSDSSSAYSPLLLQELGIGNKNKKKSSGEDSHSTNTTESVI